MDSKTTRDRRGYRPRLNASTPSDSTHFVCAECGITKPREQFSLYSSGKPGLCKPCRRDEERARSRNSSDLTAARLRELLHYDPETGIFTRRTARGGNPAGSPIGTPHGNGYLSARVQNKTRYLHRLAWLYMTGEYPEVDVDHRNTVRTDNRWSNLRKGTRGQNMQNQRRARSNNCLGVLGVSPYKGKYKAQIQVDGRNRTIGQYDTIEEASGAYIATKRLVHPFGTL